MLRPNWPEQWPGLARRNGKGRAMSSTARSTALDYDGLFAKGLPEPASRWAGFAKYNFIGGHNDPTQIPVDALGAAAQAVLQREGASLAMYNLGQGPQGYRGLRAFVADKLSRHRFIAASADDVLITSGSGQGIDLVSRLLLEPGDTVVVEEFSYGGAISKLKQLGARIAAVPLDGQGMRTDALADLLAGLKGRGITPKYIYTIPTIQNPTGSILSLERRHRLIGLSRQYGVPIFEDECYADLIWAGGAPPALYSLDPKQVIHIGSFSKSLAPALRVGYAVADWSVLGRMIACKADGGTGALDQMVIAEYFASHFDDHIARLAGVLGGKLDTMIEALEAEFGTAVEVTRPQGGIFLWLKLPDAVDVTTLVKPAAAAGLVFNPGPEWSCNPAGARSYLRLCFALPSKQEIREGVATLARVCFEQTGIPQQSANRRRV
jgi:2-aminoadipate transaminase